ncbi:MAG: hypothetical protein U5R49_12885 [Deltaproteobacteria bacterium]|nr:hypothetical protein [Deltaproteobacteria bacterium]
MGLNPADLTQTYKDVAYYPEVGVITSEVKRPDFERQKEELNHYLESAFKSLPKNVPEKGWDGLQGTIRQARLRARHFNLKQDRYFIKILTGLEKSPDITHNRWPGGKDEAEGQLALFTRFKTEVVDPCLEQWRRYCHFFIMRLVIPAVDYFRDVRQKIP